MTVAADRRVLLVEDDDAHAELIRRAFVRHAGGMELHRAESLAAARAYLAKAWPRAILADHLLPDGLGTDLLLAEAGGCPVILLTSHGDERLAVEAMRGGAVDYLVKSPETLADTPRVVDRAIRAWDQMVQHRRTEEALVASELRLRRITDNMSDVIWQLGLDGLCHYVSPSCQAALGRPADSLVGLALADLVHPEERGALLDALAQVGGWPRGLVLEMRYPCRDGGWRWMETVGSALFGRDGGVEGTILTARDIQRRRELEEQLRQSQKLQAVGQLAGGVAHDFNNLLTVIVGYGTTIREQASDEGWPIVEDLDHLLEAGDRASGLVRQLLAFSGKRVHRPRWLDLNALIRGTARMLERLIGEDVRLVLELGALPGGVRGDPGQLEMVLVNLAVNARDAMQRGGTLTIRTAPALGPDGGGAWVALRVSDTGPGVDASIRGKIFEPFFTTKEAGKGTGLGLASVLAAVLQTKGQIRLLDGPGATFEVLLPLADAAEGELAEPAAPRARGGAEGVLVVEDDGAVRDLTCRILERAGYRVYASACAMAEATYDRHVAEIDLLLSDVVMPDVDGPTLARRLRRRRPSLKVMFMSGYADAVLERRGFERAGHLPKPFAPEELQRAVRAALDEPTEPS